MLFVNNSDFKELKFFKKSSKELICTATLETLQTAGLWDHSLKKCNNNYVLYSVYDRYIIGIVIGRYIGIGGYIGIGR